jgi:hypothetical protein
MKSEEEANTLRQGTGNREQGTGNREQGTGNREQGTGNREQGIGNREQGIGTGGWRVTRTFYAESLIKGRLRAR